MPGGVVYGPVSQVSRENTDTKQGPSPRSWRRMLFIFFCVTGMLCGVACLVSVGLWGSTWGCNESEAPQQTQPRVGRFLAPDCPCIANYPIFLGIVGASLTPAAAFTFFFFDFKQTFGNKKNLPLVIAWWVTSSLFIVSLWVTLAFWGESQSTCGPELYNTGFLLLFMGISTILALCWILCVIDQ
jgi:hypothetical protein